MDDGLDGRFHEGIVDRNFQFELRQQAHFKLGPAIDLGVAALAAAASNICDRHQVHVTLIERRLNGFKLFGTDDGNDQFHSG
jgi:hypothetical protein